jgi:hypothetical protein
MKTKIKIKDAIDFLAFVIAKCFYFLALEDVDFEDVECQRKIDLSFTLRMIK